MQVKKILFPALALVLLLQISPVHASGDLGDSEPRIAVSEQVTDGHRIESATRKLAELLGFCMPTRHLQSIEDRRLGYGVRASESTGRRDLASHERWMRIFRNLADLADSGSSPSVLVSCCRNSEPDSFSHHRIRERLMMLPDESYYQALSPVLSRVDIDGLLKRKAEILRALLGAPAEPPSIVIESLEMK